MSARTLSAYQWLHTISTDTFAGGLMQNIMELCLKELEPRGWKVSKHSTWVSPTGKGQLRIVRGDTMRIVIVGNGRPLKSQLAAELAEPLPKVDVKWNDENGTISFEGNRDDFTARWSATEKTRVMGCEVAPF